MKRSSPPIYFRLENLSGEYNKDLVGGKAKSLGKLISQGLNVPKGICIPTNVYTSFITQTGLDKKIMFELSRKNFGDMRWEELWDAALRIRNLFLKAELPSKLVKQLKEILEDEAGNKPLVVRSSSISEDSKKKSFAGLHESFVNIVGIDAIIHHLKLVWASLWSDKALLYKQELGLNVNNSKMAVVIQELIEGEKSGVAFGLSPMNQKYMIIESVYGLNQGLVDGEIAPDRWTILRESGEIIDFHGEPHEYYVKTAQGGKEESRVKKIKLDPSLHNKPPLSDNQVRKIYNTSKILEEIYQSPQDMEWTFKDDNLYVLQSRPITFIDQRNDTDEIEYYSKNWYLSLHKSHRT